MGTETETLSPPGLSDTPKSEWPSVTTGDEIKDPIERLEPNSELHERVLNYILDRIKLSEREMGKFYPRWNAHEKRFQGYIDLPDWEKVLKEMNDSGKPAAAVSITIPYAFATVMTIVTYLIHTFAGRKPMFQVGSYKSETANSARLMELVLQYNADHTRLVKHLWQFFMDGEVYGLGAMRTAWKVESKFRTVWRPTEINGTLHNKVREKKTVYAGNDVVAIDPFMLFPDPRVPISEVATRGEFCFWREFEGKHFLKAMESDGEFKWVDYAGKLPRKRENSFVDGESSRSIRTGGNATPGVDNNEAGFTASDYIQIDQGTIVIIPAELGLGTSNKPEKWIFSIANGRQIIQARPFESDHDMHPVIINEPYSVGYGFGQPGLIDHIGPIQDTLSWFINSHMDNVKTALNNQTIFNPNYVEEQDLKEPGPGKLIRLKAAAMSKNINDVIQQFRVTDVTQRHVEDFQLMMRMGDTLGAVSDNLRGLQDSGGRKTATEIRASAEAGASRLAAHAKFISANSIVNLTTQMGLNIQQHLDEEFFIQLTGKDGLENSIIQGQQVNAGGALIAPQMLVGDFYYPIHDGTLPIDKVATLDIWKEIFLAVASDQELRSQFSVAKIFEHVAELGGAKNIDSMKINLNVAPGAQLQSAAQAGNAVPVTGNAPGVEANPGRRVTGG